MDVSKSWSGGQEGWRTVGLGGRPGLSVPTRSLRDAAEGRRYQADVDVSVTGGNVCVWGGTASGNSWFSSHSAAPPPAPQLVYLTSPYP